MTRLLLLSVVMAAAGTTCQAENLALGRPYTLSPAPNYDLCTDPGDATQLTDGVYTEGFFWGQPSTVGWANASPVVITIDLGSDAPIGDVSFSTAARAEAGALWPRAIFVRVSAEARAWHDAGELVALGTVQGTITPPVAAPAGHMVRRYQAALPPTHGRFVALVVVPAGQYSFVDEIEVTRGPESALSQEPTGGALAKPEEGLEQALAEGELSQVILADAAAVGRELADSSLPADEKTRLQAELMAILRGPIEVPPLVYQEIFPLNEMHRQVLALGGRIALASGRPQLQAWSGQRWDPLQPRSCPAADAEPPRLAVTLMRGEVRSAVLNLTNNLPGRRSLTIALEGLPVEVSAAIQVHEVPWTFSGTTAVAAALPAARRAGDGWKVTIPEGTTRQVWFMVDGRGLSPGFRRGSLVVAEGRGEVARVPLSVRVSAVTMPQRLSLSLGGWDYTDGPSLYYVTEPLRHSLVRFLRDYQLDAPWATKQVMPFGTHAADGAMTASPNTASMDEWLGMWRGSRWYCVFNNFEGPDASAPGLQMDDPAWGRAIGQWIHFWVAYLRTKGISPQQLCLLLVDEPRNPQTDELTIRYAEVIKAAEPDVVIWTDPIWQHPADANPRLYELADIIAPQRPMWLGQPAEYEQVFGGLQQQGKRLAFYSCSGPVRGLDPYTYHLLQAWDCFRRNMDQEFFWSFGGGGGFSPWTQVGPENMVFTPQYRTPDGWVTSRHMEAIREGRYDYEYLVMLREQIAQARGAGCPPALLTRAERLLETAPPRVLGAPGANGVWWGSAKDRGMHDRVRLEVLRMLERLQSQTSKVATP